MAGAANNFAQLWGGAAINTRQADPLPSDCSVGRGLERSTSNEPVRLYEDE